jgi:Zn-dependent peptidase ImmA (M78 family)
MNTTKKGNEFEALSVSIIEDAIRKGDLSISSFTYKLFKKKGYYSAKRGKDIIFDLSLEIWPPNADKYQLLYLIECKSYFPNTIPVNDIEEFDSHIEQVAPRNAKGILITDSKLQEGTFNFAKSQGIMVIKATKEGDYDVVLYKNDRKSNSNSIKIKNPFQGMSDETIEINDKVETFFSELFLPEDRKIIGLKHYSKNDLEKITENIIRKFDQNIFKECKPLEINKFINFLMDEYKVKTTFLPILEKENNLQLLGYYDNKNKNIFVDESIQEIGKKNFVYFHEVGHSILHTDLKISQQVYNNFSDSEFNFALDKYELTNVKNWIEWQANQFAASILMPKENVKIFLNYIQKEKLKILRNVGKIFLDDQPVNIEDYKTTIDLLAKYFKVSKSAMEYRLNALELINDERKKPFGRSIFH